MKQMRKYLGALLGLAVLVTLLTTTVLATSVSETVYASNLVDGDDIVLIGDTTLYVNADVSLKSISGDYALEIQSDGEHTLTVDNPNGSAIYVKTLKSVKPSQGTVNLTIKGGDDYFAIATTGDISLDGIKLDAKGGAGIRSEEGNVTINGTNVSVVGSDGIGVVANSGSISIDSDYLYSGKSVLSAKLVCEDCGSFYGSKVWHSTDKYRRTIWHCNSKFANEQQCTTPTVDEETVRRAFITAYNQLMRDRRQIVADCELIRKALLDLAELDAEIERQQEETHVVAELVKAAVQENASTAQSQDAYLQKYEALTKRYETAAAELERLKGIRTERERQDQAMALFIRSLKKQPEVLDARSDTIWTVMVEKVLVHKHGGLTFQFYNGSEIRIKR